MTAQSSHIPVLTDSNNFCYIDKYIVLGAAHFVRGLFQKNYNFSESVENHSKKYQNLLNLM